MIRQYIFLGSLLTIYRNRFSIEFLSGPNPKLHSFLQTKETVLLEYKRSSPNQIINSYQIQFLNTAPAVPAAQNVQEQNKPVRLDRFCRLYSTNTYSILEYNSDVVSTNWNSFLFLDTHRPGA